MHRCESTRTKCAETFLKLDGMLIAEDFSRERNVPLRVMDVARVRRIVLGLDFLTGDFFGLNQIRNFADSRKLLRTGVAVEKLARHEFAEIASRQEALQTIIPSRLDIFYHPIFDFFQKNRLFQQPQGFAPAISERDDPCQTWPSQEIANHSGTILEF